MTSSITITVSGAAEGDRATIAHTIRQALKEAALDVRNSHEELPMALTTLYEQQTRLAMAGTQCVVKTEMTNDFDCVETTAIHQHLHVKTENVA